MGTDGSGGAPHSAWAEGWAEFCERLRSCAERLVSELGDCWQDQNAIAEVSLRTFETASIAIEQTGVQDFLDTRHQTGLRLLAEPVSQWDRRRPYKRALAAIQTYDRSVEELLKALPERAPASGGQVLLTLEGERLERWRKGLARLRRGERAIPLRMLVSRQLERSAMLRPGMEHRFFSVLAEATRELRRGWELARESIDSATADGAPSPATLRGSVAALAQQAEQALAEWRRWPGALRPPLARAVLSGLLWGRAPRAVRQLGRRRTEHAAFWAGWWRLIEAELRLELALENSETRIAQLFAEGLDSLVAEQASLLAELDSVLGWLRNQLEGGAQEAFPAPKSDIVSAASRLAELDGSVRVELKKLTERCRVPGKVSVSRRRAGLRVLRPRGTLYQAYSRNGRPAIAASFEEAEAEHRKVVQEIERAREVVAFSLDESEQNRDPRLRQEALRNALSLLEFYRSRPSDWALQAGPRLVKALAKTFSETHLMLRRHRLGAAAYIAEHGFRRAWPLLARGARESLREFAVRFLRTAQRAGVRFLGAIGWKPVERPGQPEVVTRPFLPAEFTAVSATKELPALYRHLFRFEPVRDPRFLVGREREMAAIAEARTFWEAGRPASLIIVGERGSGKTSLINCALKQALQNLEVIQGDFQERLVTEAQLQAFLAAMLGAGAGGDLAELLAGRRRVIILEQLEQTFLRQIGCYGAIRELQRVVAATCANTLWILTVNAVAFRFLDAAVQLGASFSHRINAATATQADLRRAILQRHNLSGLRLHFAAPASPDHLAGRASRLIYGEPDVEDAFFGELAQESGGVFRTAFDIWLGHIEDVEAGVLYMRSLRHPDMSPVIDVLDADDLFALVAILQHGSLTAEEHAAVFHKDLLASRSQMDELLAREIIEKDPGRPGFRIRPKAMRIVTEALYRRNLL